MLDHALIFRLLTYLSYAYRRLFSPSRKFTFRGEEMRYFFHPYNFTWASERCIEVPIAMSYLKRATLPVLEVGNVLSHYFNVSHHIVDKYEMAPRVQNVDAMEFSTDVRYGLILSISTLEHIGMDGDDDIVESKIIKTIQNLYMLLAPSGKIVATVPLGFNPAMDRIVDDGKLFSTRIFMKRMNRETWVQADYDEVKGVRYGKPFKYANALCVWTIER
ncbi:MAG: hypothetical protein FJ358_07160 [Thaumarchaeota archaeon]|nr:hypothetical protein [Nitrososphaerota archaeon]